MDNNDIHSISDYTLLILLLILLMMETYNISSASAANIIRCLHIGRHIYIVVKRMCISDHQTWVITSLHHFMKGCIPYMKGCCWRTSYKQSMMRGAASG